jgi:hypothetical protein
MIVLFSWVFIIGVLGIFIVFAFMCIRFAKSRKMFSKKSGAFMIACVAISLTGAIGAISLTDPVASANDEDSKGLISDLSNGNNLPIQPDSSAFKEKSSDTQSIDLVEDEDPSEALLQKELESFMYESFGGSGDEKYAASWYRSIKSFRIHKESDGTYTITVDSTLYHDDEGKKFAEEIPPAFFGWANSSKRNIPVWAVIVNGQSGKPLIHKENPINPIATSN